MHSKPIQTWLHVRLETKLVLHGFRILHMGPHEKAPVWLEDKCTADKVERCGRVPIRPGWPVQNNRSSVFSPRQIVVR
jgi:hypothetical protein